jgi:glutamyl-tRNA synthetase
MANVVDDHLMEITHIMRAQEWLPSAPLHRILYDALGWKQPQLCHLPMVMGKDGHKLSKRHGATTIREFRTLGYLPQALINYIALVGWSFDDSREFFTLEELEKLFSMEKINKAPAVFDYQKLDWFNGSYIRALTPAQFAAGVKPFLVEAGFIRLDSPQDELVAGIAPLVQERVKLLSEVPAMVRFIFEDPAPPAAAELVPKKTEPAAALLSLRKLSALLPSLGATAEQNEAPLRALAEELGVKLGDMLMPLRVAVTGSRVSPPLFESMHVMGLEKAAARVSRAIAILGEHVTRS